MRKRYWVPLVSLLTAATALAGPATSSAPAPDANRTAALRSCFGTYDNAPRRADDGRVDIPRLARQLHDLRANTYNWLIWHRDTDWEDLQRFLPIARLGRIRVWVTVVPPSESPPRAKTYSEPHRLDYKKWAVEIARLSLREEALVAWSIDDFNANIRETFTPEYTREMLESARAINPRLAFVPCVYFRGATAEFARTYGPLLDGILFPYRSESTTPGLTDAGRVEREMAVLRERFGPRFPIVLDVYATAHSRLGDSTPEYVEQVMLAGRRHADGVMVYCHQDPEQKPEKYGVTRRLFRAFAQETPNTRPWR